MELIEIYNSTVVVYWAVAYIPQAIHDRNLEGYLTTLGVLLFIELFLMWPRHTFPLNVLASIFVIACASVGGWIVYEFEFKKKKEKEKDNS